jgi:hypothetical protein
VLSRQTRYGDSCVPQLPVDVLRYAAACVCDSEGWQYLSISVFLYGGVAEYLGIDTSVLQY